MIDLRNLSASCLILFTGIFVLDKCYANSDVQIKLIENGWEYVSQGKDDKAKELMRELEQSQYKNQAQVLLGAIQYNNGNYIEAIGTLSKVKEYFDKAYNEIIDKHIE